MVKKVSDDASAPKSGSAQSETLDDKEKISVNTDQLSPEAKITLKKIGALLAVFYFGLGAITMIWPTIAVGGIGSAVLITVMGIGYLKWIVYEDRNLQREQAEIEKKAQNIDKDVVLP